CDGAAPFEECDVAPAAVVAADALAGADHAESGLLVQAKAGGVLGEDAGLDGPDPRRLGRADERGEQRGCDPAPPGLGADVDRMLAHPLVNTPLRDANGGDPAEHVPVAVDGHVPVQWQPGPVELLPGRDRGLEARLPGVEAGLVDGQDLAGSVLGL